MTSEHKVRKSGYAYLRAKLVKKEEEIANLKAEMVRLRMHLSLAQERYSQEQERNKLLNNMLQEVIQRMGWLRRFIYNY